MCECVIRAQGLAVVLLMVALRWLSLVEVYCIGGSGQLDIYRLIIHPHLIYIHHHLHQLSNLSVRPHGICGGTHAEFGGKQVQSTMKWNKTIINALTAIFIKV